MPRIITAGHAAVIAHTVECCEAVLRLVPLDTPLFSGRLIRTALMIGRAREAAHMLPAADWDLMRDDITTTEKRGITGTLHLCEVVLQRRTDGVSVAEETIHCLGGMIEYLRVTRATGYPPGVAGNPTLNNPSSLR